MANTRRFRFPGWRLLAALGACVGWLGGSVLRIRRGHVVRSLRRAGIAHAEQVAGGMYRSLGTGLCELLAAAVLPRRALAGRVAVDIPQALRDAPLAVAATAHTANWDLVACEVARVVPLTVVTKRLSVGWLDRLWQRIRRRHGVRLAVQGSAMVAARQACRTGGVVAMLVDQAPERERGATVVPFLGRSAWVDLAPALVAMRLRCPLIAAFPVREFDGSYALHVAGRLDPPRHATRAWAVEAMTAVTGWLEDFVRRYPDQWLWMHRRWKGVEAEPERVGCRAERGLATGVLEGDSVGAR